MQCPAASLKYGSKGPGYLAAAAGSRVPARQSWREKEDDRRCECSSYGATGRPEAQQKYVRDLHTSAAGRVLRAGQSHSPPLWAHGYRASSQFSESALNGRVLYFRS